MWPRACAFAERLWTDPQQTTWREAEQRLLEHRRRLVHERGLHADAMMPEFCRQVYIIFSPHILVYGGRRANLKPSSECYQKPGP